MPATVKVKVCEARHLPVMDRSGETTDAFVEVRLANNIFKTDVCRRTLNPKWESEWFRFEVNDIELQEEPLQIRVMDYDTYSSHDAIGKIYVDLTNILMSENRTIFAGWLPIYDTLLGIRGELKIEIRLIPFCVDMKSLRHFSHNILFFSSALFPSGFRIRRIIGLVDHSLVAEDPEHQWLDKIRTPRSTNEARQLLFLKMSGELRRKLGNKVSDMGGNAVIALRQRIDLGHVGVIIRAIGTAAIVEKLTAGNQLPAQDGNDTSVVSASSPGGPRKMSKLDTVTGSPEVTGLTGIKQYVDDPDLTILSESVYPEGNAHPGGLLERDAQQSADMTRPTLCAEFPFLTLKHIPAGVVKSIGGIVSCKMIKTLERLEQDDINQASYAQWWKEIRMEIFRHMKGIGCNAVYGYAEELCLTDEGNIQLLSAVGTAAVLDIDLATKDRDCDTILETAWGMVTRENFRRESSVLVYPEAISQTVDCKIYHIPSGEYADHIVSTSAQCGVCKVGHVPEIVLATVEIPDGSPIKGMGTLVQARVQRKTRVLKGESGARELSDAMPFIEYDLHSQISTKLKLLGCNAAFNLKMELQCGSEVIIASATCTAACILALPRPMRPVVLETDKGAESADIQNKLDNTLELYLRQLGLSDEKDDKTGKTMRPLRSAQVKKKKTGPRQFSKSGFIIDLENEKSEGRDIVSLIDYLPPKDTLLLGSEICPMQDRWRQLRYTEFAQNPNLKTFGPFVQSFCRIWKTGKVFGEQEDADDLALSCQHLLRDVVFRARMYKPCRVAGIKFRFQLNPNDELLIMVQGCIFAEPLPLYACLKGTQDARRSLRHVSSRAGISGCEDNGDVMPLRIPAEELSITEGNTKDTHFGLTTPRVGLLSALRTRMSPPRPSQIFFQHQATPHSLSSMSVDISSLSFVHSGTVKRYVGNLNIVVLRECQALRDNDGLSGFMQRALADFYAMVRSQTVAAGGNAVLSFYIAQLQLADSYNQAQCIIHAYGDMVEVEDVTGANVSEA